MTDKQIKAARAILPHNLADMTEEQYRVYNELQCREMINSCLVYGQAYCFYDVKTGKLGCYADHYLRTLDASTIKRLFNEQSADFAKAIVKKNVHQDSEGVTYNSVIWADEQ